MAWNSNIDDNGDFGNAFQRQFKRGIGIGGSPDMIESKRNRQDPAPKGYGGSGLEDNGPVGAEVGFGGFGGAGGPMPIPDGGPGWRRNAGDQNGGGGGPMPIPDRGDQNGGGGGQMPMPPPWIRFGGKPEDYGVTMEFGGPGAVNPVGMGPQDLQNYYNPPPPPPRPTPPPMGGNTGFVPPLGGGFGNRLNASAGAWDVTGDQPNIHEQTPMPFLPRDGSGYMGGPRRQPGDGWKWGDPSNLMRGFRRF